MKYTAVITAPGVSKEILAPEMVSKERSSMEIADIDGGCKITITANDAIALKTSFMSVTKYLEVTEKVRKNG